MRSSKISRDKGSLGNGPEDRISPFRRSIPSPHGNPPPSPRAPLAVSMRIFIARFRCIAQNADKSHYPETTAALERAAYLAPA